MHDCSRPDDDSVSPCNTTVLVQGAYLKKIVFILLIYVLCSPVSKSIRRPTYNDRNVFRQHTDKHT